MAESSNKESGGEASTKTHLDRIGSAIRSVKYEHLVAGISGGVVSTLVLHPLDLLKIRFAVDDGNAKRPHYSGLFNAFREIVKAEGMSGLYKGVTPNVTGAGTAWGLYFLSYNAVKTEMQGGNPKYQLSPAMHMLAAAQAGVFTVALTNPIWVIKTRLCLQYEAGKSIESPDAYRGMLDGLRRIAREEGIRGLYKGFVPGLFGVTHGAIQFMVYEEMKSSYNNHKQQPIDTKLGSFEYVFFAALSKLVAAVTTYPYQLVRARLQDKLCNYDGSIDCIRKTLRNEGVLAFYKGLGPNLMRVVPATAITFLVYEKVSAFMLSRNSKT